MAGRPTADRRRHCHRRDHRGRRHRRHEHRLRIGLSGLPRAQAATNGEPRSVAPARRSRGLRWRARRARAVRRQPAPPAAAAGAPARRSSRRRTVAGRRASRRARRRARKRHWPGRPAGRPAARVPCTAACPRSCPAQVARRPCAAGVAAMPKSNSRARPSAPIMTLPGLTSRWTSPRAWAWARASATSAAIAAASPGLRRRDAASLSGEGLAADEGEGERGLAATEVGVEQRHDVRVVEPAGSVGFGGELRDARRRRQAGDWRPSTRRRDGAVCRARARRSPSCWCLVFRAAHSGSRSDRASGNVTRRRLNHNRACPTVGSQVAYSCTY